MIQYIKNKYENESIRQCRNKVDISGDLMTGLHFFSCNRVKRINLSGCIKAYEIEQWG